MSLTEIKEGLKSGKAIIGTKEVIKNLKLGKLSKVFITSNAPASVKESVNKFASISGAEVVELRYANDELGTICKKTFSISVLGFSK